MLKKMRTFDYLVIGGGSAGIAGARRAAEFGAKVALLEPSSLGGTCVNVGCVPKKIMFYAANYAEKIENFPSYGFQVDYKNFSWKQLKDSRDSYIKRLNEIYLSNLKKSNVEVIQGFGSFTKNKTIEINGETISADHILISTGCFPSVPTDIPGHQYGIDSDGFFSLDYLPKKVVIVGAGYIAVELAGILRALGSQVTILIRHDKVLRQFDSLIADAVTQNLEHMNVNILKGTQIAQVKKDSNTNELEIFTDNNIRIDGVSSLIWAIGRSPNTKLGLENIGVQLNNNGFIKVDEYQNTTVPGVYAVGDICGKVLLTPVAIAASRKLSHRIFNKEVDSKLDYENIPSAIYCHPPAASIGLSQRDAEKKYGKEMIKVFASSFTPLHDAVLEKKGKFSIKLVCLLPSEKIVGLHMVGDGCDEILQGFSVAVKMGATKQDFDRTIAIHPTSAEELVLMR